MSVFFFFFKPNTVRMYRRLLSNRDICKVSRRIIVSSNTFLSDRVQATPVHTLVANVTFRLLIFLVRLFRRVFNAVPIVAPDEARENSVSRESLVRGQSVSCTATQRSQTTWKKELLLNFFNYIYPAFAETSRLKLQGHETTLPIFYSFSVVRARNDELETLWNYRQRYVIPL